MKYDISGKANYLLRQVDVSSDMERRILQLVKMINNSGIEELSGFTIEKLDFNGENVVFWGQNNKGEKYKIIFDILQLRFSIINERFNFVSDMNWHIVSFKFVDGRDVIFVFEEDGMISAAIYTDVVDEKTDLTKFKTDFIGYGQTSAYVAEEMPRLIPDFTKSEIFTQSMNVRLQIGDTVIPEGVSIINFFKSFGLSVRDEYRERIALNYFNKR